MSRLSVNLVTIFVTTVTVFLTVSVTDGFTFKIFRELSKDCGSFNIGSDMPNYTNWEDDTTYLSGSVIFDAKAMAGYYGLTRSFINSILDPNFIKLDMIVWKQSGDSYYPNLSDKVSVNDLLKDYWVLIFVFVLIVVISLIIPITGILFCCCRCCGNCGAKSEPSNPKKENCNKIIQAALIILLGTLLLMSVVCAFATNKQMQEGTDEFSNNIRKSYRDASLYLSSTKSQADNLLVTNYKDFSSVFKTTLQNSGTNVMQKMSIWQGASSLFKLLDFVEKMPNITGNLMELKTSTDMLKAEVTSAKHELDNIKTSLMSTLNECDYPQCKTVNDQILALNFNIDVAKIPDITPAINILSGLNENDLRSSAEMGKTNLNELGTKINKTLETYLIKATDQIDSAGTTIEENLKYITDAVGDLETQVNSANNSLEDAYSYITTYSPYIYYGGLVISCVLLLIPFCIMLGLIWGICGGRPEKYIPNSCTKDTGSVFLLSGVLLIFIFTVVIGLLTCAMLIFGLAADIAVCYPLRNPEDSTVIKIIDDFIIKNKKVDLDFRLSDILVRCRENESVYQVFNLSEKFELDDLNSKFNIASTVDNISKAIQEKLNEIIDKSFTILDTPNLKELQTLTLIDPDIHLEDFEGQFNQSMTNMDLQNVIQPLEQIFNILDPTSSTRDQLENNIKQLKNFDTNTLQPLVKNTQETLVLAETLNNDLKMNSTSFSEAIKKFLKNVEDAQLELANNNNEIIPAAVNCFGEVITNQVQSYLDRVINITKFELGRCGPLNVATNSVLIASCDKIVLPWNGFWVSLFISLLVFVPTIIVSISLASLYRRYKINKTHLGGQRLKPGKTSKKGKRQDVPYPSNGVASRYPSESRYDDMAPNNWILLHPEGATRSRTLFEYERPPPYYYPGFFEL